MTDSLDDYIRDTIRAGDEGSKFLAAMCAQTLKNNSHVNVLKAGMNGIAVLDDIPGDHYVLVHSGGGNPKIEDSEVYAYELINKLALEAKSVSARPIAFSDIVDASRIDNGTLANIVSGLQLSAKEHGLAAINGELADLGKRVNCDANMSATMISLVKKNIIFPGVHIHKAEDRGKFMYNGVNYAYFDPKGKPVFVNSDGVGTKTEFYERSGDYRLAVNDFFAMNTDDAIKIGARVQVVSGVLETRGELPIEEISRHAWKLAKSMNILGMLQHEDVGERIRSYSDELPSYNISGSTVSTLDRERLHSLPRPNENEWLVAIKGHPNPRSNGITAKRKVMSKLFGEKWHKTPAGEIFLDYLARPSTILYPSFRDLDEQGLATSFYHLSGGAFKGKLAKPIAKQGLFVEIDGLFVPDWREVTLAAYSLSVRDAYEKWPMGTDGFVTTKNLEGVKKVLAGHGLESKAVGILRSAQSGRTGVEFSAYNGERVYFSGED